MKALSIKPGYAMLIVAGLKTIECRSWKTNYRGDILICSTVKKEKYTIPSHALGIVTLKDVVPFKKSHLKAANMDYYDEFEELYAWKLTNPRLIKPIPIKGKLSLWEYDGEVEVMKFDTEADEEKFIQEYWDPIII